MILVALLDSTKTFDVKTNAYGEGIGTVLMQEGHPIAYINKSLLVKSFNSPLMKRSYLLFAIKHWEHYLVVGNFIIRTYHASLKCHLEYKLTILAQEAWPT